MTDKNQNFNINNMLEPIDIDLDKLFSLSYTFDNLKSFMKHIIKNQQTIADKINDLEKKSSAQKEESKKNQQFIFNIERRIKSIEIGNAKSKKELKLKQEEEGDKTKKSEKKDKDGKDVTDKETKKEKKESNADNINKELELKRVSDKKLTKNKEYDKENESSYDDKYDEYSNQDFYTSNQEIQEIKDRLEILENNINKEKKKKKIKEVTHEFERVNKTNPIWLRKKLT